MRNLNRWIGTGNLTKDPELRTTPNGQSVCTLRIAVNDSRKNPSTEEWEEVPNFFTVVVWGKQGENAARYLSKGRPVAIDGRLRWREYEKDNSKREVVEIVADSVQFLGDGKQEQSSAPARQQGGDDTYGSPAPAASGTY